MRASDHRRGRTVGELAGSWSEGYLGADTFEARVSAAYAARTPAQLDRLTCDLPPRSLAELSRRLWRWVWGPERPHVLCPPPCATSGQTLMTVGRHRHSNLMLDDPTVSRQHATVRLEGGRWVLRDLASTNGTRVNGWRVEEAVLNDGDQLTVGAVELLFRT